MTLPLLVSVFVVATCGLIYELVAGALASYLLGDSITQFSTVIGVYLFAMGVGSYLSRYVTKSQLAVFIRIELLVGILGGFSSTILFLVFANGAFFALVLYLLVFAIGVGVGLEIPLLMNILRDEMSFRELVSQVLSFDYVGALVASVAFPIFFLPHLGLVRTALLFGILNVSVALAMAVVFARSHPSVAPLRFLSTVALALLATAFAFGESILDYAEASVYPDRVVYAANTKYQRVVVTRGVNSLKLHLNGHLQFDSLDEYRYHEALVHVGLHSIASPKQVLVLGGGDGLAVREILKYPSIEKVTLVDLDPGMTVLFRDSPLLAGLNGDVFRNPRVSVVNDDAFVWLRTAVEEHRQYDFVVVDFPDPTNFSLGKLYTTAIYKLLKQVVAPRGAAVIQSTSPLVARQSFWCVAETLKAVGFVTAPYHAYVQSFGEWGFVLASHEQIDISGLFPKGLRFITPEIVASLMYFPPDMDATPVDINRLNNQALVHYYEKEWGRYGL